MKTWIAVENRKEGDLLRAGLEHKETRVLVKVIGALFRLPSDHARARALRWMIDKLDEEVKS